MFTGIIEHIGTVESLKANAEGGRLKIHAPTVLKNLKVSRSIAVNGCCLTVVEIDADHFSADLSGETLRKTSIGEWKSGTRVNLEQPLVMELVVRGRPDVAINDDRFLFRADQQIELAVAEPIDQFRSR